MPDIAVDDLVETPAGDARVVEVNWARETFLGELLDSGLVVEWQLDEVEELAVPDPHDTEAVERWLRLAAIVVPSLVVESDTVRCNANDCPCGFCYRIIRRLSGRATRTRTEITHHKDAEVCACDFDGGSAHSTCGCMDTVNIRWTR